MACAPAQAPQPPSLARKPAVRLRPFFWNKLAWKPDHIWATVPPGALSEAQLAALEALFPQAAPSPLQAKAAKAKSEARPDTGACSMPAALAPHPWLPVSVWKPAGCMCTILRAGPYEVTRIRQPYRHLTAACRACLNLASLESR